MPESKIAFTCIECEKRFVVPVKHAGKKARCSGCGSQMRIPKQSNIERNPAPIIAFEHVSVECFCERTLKAPVDMGGMHALCPYCGEEVFIANESLHGETNASLPGGIRIQKLRTMRHFPQKPLVWIGAMVLVSLLAIGVLILDIGFWIFLALFFGVYGLYYFGLEPYFDEIGEHMKLGCINPGIVASTDPMLIAVATDLIRIDEQYPVIKILSQPLTAVQGKKPKVGARLSTVAMYEGYEQETRWRDFHPIAVDCVTNDPASLRHTFTQLTEEHWRELAQGLAQVSRPYEPGLYPVSDQAASSSPG